MLILLRLDFKIKQKLLFRDHFEGSHSSVTGSVRHFFVPSHPCLVPPPSGGQDTAAGGESATAEAAAAAAETSAAATTAGAATTAATAADRQLRGFC